jgi:hypothetical protein
VRGSDYTFVRCRTLDLHVSKQLSWKCVLLAVAVVVGGGEVCSVQTRQS